MQKNLKLPSEILEPAIISHSLKNTSFFLKIKKYLDTSAFKKKSYFSDEKFQKIFNVICKWNDKYKTFPKKKELQIIFDKLEPDEEIKIVFNSAIEKVYEDTEEVSLDFLEEEVTRFIKENRVYEAMMMSQIDLQEGNFSAIKTRMEEAVLVNFDKDLGLSVRDFDESISLIEEIDNLKSVSTGLPKLDAILDGGFKSREIYIFSGIPGLGKTAILGNFAVNAFLDGKKIVVYTLETHSRRLLSRYYTNLAEMTKKEILLQKEDAKKKIKDTLSLTEGDIIIKYYNAHEINSNDIMAHLNDLKMYRQWEPDLIVVDYLLLMKSNDASLSSDNSYKYYKTVTEELRNIANTLDCPLLSATQINRDGMGDKGGTKPITTAKNISESRGIYDTCDFFATLNQTNRAKEKNEILMYIDKWRNGENGGKINCTFDYQHMIIKEI